VRHDVDAPGRRGRGERQRHGGVGVVGRERHGRVGLDLYRSELPAHGVAAMTAHPHGFGWRALDGAARVYVALVILVRAAVVLTGGARHEWPRPALFAFLLGASCLTSSWKVNLPIPLASGSTLSVSYAANLTALLMLGPQPAMLVAIAGVWTQCVVH